MNSSVLSEYILCHTRKKIYIVLFALFHLLLVQFLSCVLDGWMNTLDAGCKLFPMKIEEDRGSYLWIQTFCVVLCCCHCLCPIFHTRKWNLNWCLHKWQNWCEWVHGSWCAWAGPTHTSAHKIGISSTFLTLKTSKNNILTSSYFWLWRSRLIFDLYKSWVYL
jgi:hypothetical protein